MLLTEQLKQIPDHRKAKGKKYSLWVILAISLIGSLCGYIGYRPPADFAALHQEQLSVLSSAVRRLSDCEEDLNS